MLSPPHPQAVCRRRLVLEERRGTAGRSRVSARMGSSARRLRHVGSSARRLGHAEISSTRGFTSSAAPSAGKCNVDTLFTRKSPNSLETSADLHIGNQVFHSVRYCVALIASKLQPFMRSQTRWQISTRSGDCCARALQHYNGDLHGTKNFLWPWRRPSRE